MWRYAKNGIFLCLCYWAMSLFSPGSMPWHNPSSVFVPKSAGWNLTMRSDHFSTYCHLSHPQGCLYSLPPQPSLLLNGSPLWWPTLLSHAPSLVLLLCHQSSPSMRHIYYAKPAFNHSTVNLRMIFILACKALWLIIYQRSLIYPPATLIFHLTQSATFTYLFLLAEVYSLESHILVCLFKS